MSSSTYTFRRSAYQKPRTYELTDQGISISQENRQIALIRYDKIESLRLYYKPERFKTFNYACTVKYIGGSYSIFSVNYEGIGNFSDQKSTYVPFVESFVEDVFKNHPQIKVYGGMSPAKYWLYLLLILMTFFILLLSFVFFPYIEPITFILRLIFILYLFYYSYKMMKNGKPRVISEMADIPDNVLPKI